MTWEPRVWRLKQGPLTKSEQSLVNGTLRRINRVLGLCECGKPPAPIGRRDRCAACWEKRR